MTCDKWCYVIILLSFLVSFYFYKQLPINHLFYIFWATIRFILVMCLIVLIVHLFMVTLCPFMVIFICFWWTTLLHIQKESLSFFRSCSISLWVIWLDLFCHLGVFLFLFLCGFSGGGVTESGRLIGEWWLNGAGDESTEQGLILSNECVASVGRSEERVESKGKATYKGLDHDWKNYIMDRRGWNELPA